MNKIILKLNPFELGILSAIISQAENRKDFPKSLHLKIMRASTECYLEHPTLKKKAKEDIINYDKEITELEKNE